MERKEKLPEKERKKKLFFFLLLCTYRLMVLRI